MHVRKWLGAGFGLALWLGVSPAAAVTQAPIVGEIDYLQLDPNALDRYAGGVMVIGGQNVILPRNLLVDLPAARMTLAQLFELAPPGCAGTSGLARADACRAGLAGAIATVKANRLDSGQVVAGEVFIQKGVESIAGVITYIDHTAGFFMLNGVPGSADAGVMVRINEPLGRHTIQSGPGCAAGSINCSPDTRFSVDADNYTAAFATGYPLCIPSTVTGGARTAGATPDGQDDPFCPTQNRTVSPVPDSTRYAPLLLGDSVLVEGNFETVDGIRFLSAWSVEARAALVTRDLPTQPDYLTLAESVWDVPGFDNQRTRFLLIGFTTLPTSPLDVFGIHYDLANGAHELPVGSTINNPVTTNQGLPPNPGGIFRIRYDVDFVDGADDDRRAPCTNLSNAGFAVCPPNPTTSDELAVLYPAARDLVARTRRNTPLDPGVTALDLLGRAAPHGEYLSPVGLEHPEFVEIDLGRLATPFAFSGLTWNLDRRLGPGGCEGTCEAAPQPLDPFPFEGLDPRANVPFAAASRVLSYWPFAAADQAPWPPPPGVLPPIGPTPAVPPLCMITTPVQPTLASIAPAVASAGTGGTVVITGTGFLVGSSCSFGDGVSVACTVDSPTQLTAVFTIAADATPGPRDVIVSNAGGTATLAGSFTVAAGQTTLPAPLLSSVTPASAAPGDLVSVSIAGGNFVPGATCSFGTGIFVALCEAITASELVADLQVEATALPGARLVTVTNPDGQSASLANGFAIIDDQVPPPGGNQIFFDDFERVGSALGNGWAQRGTWNTTDGTARGLTSLARATAPLSVPTDVVVEAKVLLTVANQRAGLIARANGGEFYTAVVRNDRVQLLRYAGGAQTTLAQFPTTLAANTWVDLGLSVTGTDPVAIEVRYLGSPVIQVTDGGALRLTSGGVGIRTGSEPAWFDDFRVSVP